MKKLSIFLAAIVLSVAAIAGRGPGAQPIVLAWDAPADGVPELYTVYENNVAIGDVIPPQTTFTVWPIAPGWYDYSVTDWQNETESAPSNVVTVYVWKFKGKLIYSVVQ